MPVTQGGGAAGGGARASGAVVLYSGVQSGPLSSPASKQSAPRDAAPANSYPIVNNNNTDVGHVGNGVYRITKTAGVFGAYDAGAVSQTGITGDFVLQLTPAFNNNLWFAGLNTDPLTNDDYTSIDFAWGFDPGTSQWFVFESGVGLTSGLAHLTSVWIWRSGTAIGYGRGADLATAQASPDRTTTSSATLYFDSSLYTTTSSFDAYLYVPAALSYTLTANSGSYAITGNSAQLLASRQISGNLSTYAITGLSGALKAQRKISGNLGSYSLTGLSASLNGQRKITLQLGTYTLTGLSSALKAQRLISVSVGSYSLSGQSAVLSRAVRLSGQVGSYALSGQSAGMSALRKLLATQGTYALTGKTAALLKSQILTLGIASYVLTGKSVILAYSGTGGGGVAKPRVAFTFFS